MSPFVAAVLMLLPACGGAATLQDVKTVIVIQQENRSFDHYYTDLALPEYYGAEVDVMDVTLPVLTDLRSPKVLTPFWINPDRRIDPVHSFRAMWKYYNNGGNNRFRPNCMGYYRAADLPFYFKLANEFAISDRYFSPALAPTHVNRSYMQAGTSYGQTGNFTYRTLAKYGTVPYTIFDSLRDHGHTWGYYTDGKAFVTKLYGPAYVAKPVADFDVKLAAGTLEDLVFLESELNITSEHPSPGKDRGLAWVEEQVTKIMNSPSWENIVIFLTYDMSGGFYDHVPPPEAIPPDDYPPVPSTGTHLKYGRNFARYGFRTPLLVVSPFAKKHYVSHIVADHTSVLRFIRTRFDLPPLARRDAVAHDLMDMFEFAE